MTETKRIPWFVPRMTGGERAYLDKALDADFLNDGPLTTEFETRIAAFLGVRHCIAVTSGTAAISLALLAKGVTAGDEVIVPDLTFIATGNAVTMIGATIRLVDVDPHRLTLDVASVEAAIGPRTRAVVAVDVNGRGADYAALEPLCRRHGLALVCDSAEALGSAMHGRKLGAFGDAGCFSFSAAKTVTTGQGGMIATDDDALHDRLRELKDQGRRYRGTGGDDAHPVLGFNFKYTDLQAAVGLAQLEVIEERLEKARVRDRWYRDALAGVNGLQFPDMDSVPDEVRQWTDILLEDKDVVRRHLDTDGIGCRAFWHPMHTHGPYETAGAAFPVATRISREGLWLASHFDLTEAEVGRTVDGIRAALRA